MLTTILSSVAAPALSLLSIGGQKYYSRYFNDKDPVYFTLIDILHTYKDDPLVHSVCRTAVDGEEIIADMACFRLITSKWDYSDRARMKVRIQYNQMSHAIVVMCKKQYQLESFICKFNRLNFVPSDELVLIESS